MMFHIRIAVFVASFSALVSFPWCLKESKCALIRAGGGVGSSFSFFSSTAGKGEGLATVPATQSVERMSNYSKDIESLFKHSAAAPPPKKDSDGGGDDGDSYGDGESTSRERSISITRTLKQSRNLRRRQRRKKSVAKKSVARGSRKGYKQRTRQRRRRRRRRKKKKKGKNST